MRQNAVSKKEKREQAPAVQLRLSLSYIVPRG